MHNCVAWHGPYSLRQATPLRPPQTLSSRTSASMVSLSRFLSIVLVATAIALAGCRQQRPPVDGPYPNSAMGVALTKIEYPDVEVPSAITQFPVEAPRTLRDLSNVQYWDLTLQDTVRLALINSPILRDLGGAVTRAPDTQIATQDPALTETDPRFGVEGALSAFDATLLSTLNAERIDRRVNNRFLGQLGFLQGDTDAWDTEIAKRNAR